MSTATNPREESNQASIAVIIAHFNGENFIERAILSALNQTDKPNELIIVDDGSNARSLNSLKVLAPKYKFKLYVQENSGQSAARNLGVEKATSDFICFLDQDDYFLPNHIRDLVNAWDYSDPNLAFTYGDLWRANEAGQIIAHSCVNAESQHPHKELRTLIRTNMYILPSASLIKREAFLKIGGFDEQFRGYEDDDLFLRFFCKGYSNRFVKNAVTVWVLNKSSTSFSESMARSRFLYFKKLMESFPAGSIPNEKVFGDLLAPRFAFQFAADVISAAFIGDTNFKERQGRLTEFVKIFRSSSEVSRTPKTKFIFATFPLIKLPATTLKMFLNIALYISPMLEKMGFPGLTLFIARYREIRSQQKNLRKSADNVLGTASLPVQL